jgi:hypothetical protein
VKLDEIEFASRLELESHPRFAAFNRSIGLRDFTAYREVFERGWAELSIMCGENVRLEQLPVSDVEPADDPLVNLMGVNSHSPKRVKFATEFFSEYERLGRKAFLDGGKKRTDYFADLVETAEVRMRGLPRVRRVLEKRKIMREINGRIATFLNVYENMKRFNSLVGGAHVLHDTAPNLKPTDVPWAIDYRGYVKLRDGAHRRAAARGLGWPTIPTLIFEFDRIDSKDFAQAHPYIRDNFRWFVDIVQMVAVYQQGQIASSEK